MGFQSAPSAERSLAAGRSVDLVSTEPRPDLGGHVSGQIDAEGSHPEAEVRRGSRRPDDDRGHVVAPEEPCQRKRSALDAEAPCGEAPEAVDLPRDVAAEIGSWFGVDEVN